MRFFDDLRHTGDRRRFEKICAATPARSKAARSFATIWAARSEWPPSSKKLSSTPIFGKFKASLQTCATNASISVRGSVCPHDPRRIRPAVRRRQGAPIELCRSATVAARQARTKFAGIMNSGSWRFKKVRSSPVDGARFAGNDVGRSESLAKLAFWILHGSSPVPSAHLQRQPKHSRTARMARQRCFDFAQLDPAAANFYLIVGAAQRTRCCRRRDSAPGLRSDRYGTRILG